MDYAARPATWTREIKLQISKVSIFRVVCSVASEKIQVDFSFRSTERCRKISLSKIRGGVRRPIHNLNTFVRLFSLQIDMKIYQAFGPFRRPFDPSQDQSLRRKNEITFFFWNSDHAKSRCVPTSRLVPPARSELVRLFSKKMSQKIFVLPGVMNPESDLCQRGWIQK